MASPFKIFRKNQKAWMVALTILAMISFVFLSNVGSSPSGRGSHEDPEVFSWKFGKVNESDLQNRIQLQHKVLTFFYRTGSGSGRTDQEINQFLQSRFPTSEREVVAYMLLNKKAEDLGIVVSDDMVRNLIRAWTEGKLSGQQMSEITRGLANNAGSINQAQLFDAIRFNLAAQYAYLTFSPNFMRANQFMAFFHGDTPAERWDYFERLNRKASTEIMPVAVKDFVEKIPDPTAKELQEFYDQYKSDYQIPGSRTPGFREPYKAQLEYVKADNAKLIEETLPTVTEQEIKDYYEKHKDTFFRKSKLSDLEKDDSKPADAAKDAPADTKSDAAKSDAKSDPGETKATDKAEANAPPAKSAPADPKSTDAKSDASKSDAAKSDAAKSSPKSDTKSDAKAPATKSGEKSGGTKGGAKSTKGADGKQSRVDSQLNGELMALADDAIYLAQAPAQGNAKAADSKADAKATAAKVEAKSADTKAATDAKSADSKADAKAPTEKSAEGKAGDAPATTGAEPPPGREVEYEPLDKVEGKIKNQIAQNKVDERVMKAFAAIETQLSRYRSALDSQRAAELAGKSAAKQIQPPDLEALAKEHGLQYRKTNLTTDRQVYDNLDIGKSRRPVVPGMRTMPSPFVQVAFQTDANGQPSAKLFSFEESEDNENNKYLWWKIADQPASTPPLETIKPEVIQAWKQIKARKLASDKADEYAAQVRKSKQTLKEAFGSMPGEEIVTPGPFSWLTRPPEQPFAQPRMSEVTGVDQVGYEFMQNVFKLKPGETGVAPNDPLTVYYVVQMESEEPSVQTLRENFMTAMSDPMSAMTYAAIGAIEHGGDSQTWFKELEQQYGVKMADTRPLDARR
jgi:hypothetical protein